MRIILDASEVYEPRGASFKYFNELIPRIAAAPDITVEVLPSPTAAISPQASEKVVVHERLMPAASWFPDGALKRWLSARKKALEKTIQLARSRGQGPALFHAFYYTLPPDPKMPLLTMVLDLITELMGERFPSQINEPFRRRKEHAIRSAQGLMAISAKTRDDLCAVYGIDPKKVDVVHLGVNYDFFSRPHTADDENKIRAKYAIDFPYLLFVGGRLNHKNFSALAHAYAKSPLRRDFPLVVAGEAWGEGEEAFLDKLGIRDRVHLALRPDEDELRLLYRLTQLFVYPSLYEGFGLPPLEAMASGAPVLAARAGSIPEVAGDGADYCDPENPDDIAKKMEALIDPARAKALADRGLKRAREMTWDRTAEGTLAAYRRLIP